MSEQESHATEGHNIQVTADELMKVLVNLGDLKDAVSEANGELRAEIKNVLESRGWHKKALAEIRAIHAMSPSARKDFLASFTPMFEVMQGLWKGEQPDLFDETEQEEGEE